MCLGWGFCKLYKQTVAAGTFIELFRGPDWKRLKWNSNVFPCTAKNANLGLTHATIIYCLCKAFALKAYICLDSC